MKHIYKYITMSILLLAVSACNSETDGPVGKDGIPVEVSGTISEAKVDSRASFFKFKHLSYNKFADGDCMGLFSSGGLVAKNQPLTYSQKTFSLDGIVWGDKSSAANSVFGYFPHSDLGNTVDNKTVSYKINLWRGATTGYDDYPIEEGFEDLLVAEKKNVPYGTRIDMAFKHKFALLAIFRGNGFADLENGGDISEIDPGNQSVIVTLTHNVEKEGLLVRVNNDYPTLSLLEGNSGSKTELTGSLGVNQEGTPCYYVIIPVGNFNSADGKPLSVESFTLYGLNNQKYVIPNPYIDEINFESNKSYIITVQKRDDGATIEPVEIIDWEDEFLHFDGPIGIESADDLKACAAAYNSPEGDERIALLKRYGSFNGAGGWTFYLTQSLDLENVDLGKNIFENFTDVLDGKGNTITGLTLKGGDNCGICGTLNGGTIKNLTLENVTLESTGSNNGSFVGVMESGKLINCYLKGAPYSSSIKGTAHTGGLIGWYKGGELTDCESTILNIDGNDNNGNLAIGYTGN